MAHDWICLLAFVGLITSPLGSLEYFVSPTGEDTAPGSEAEPWGSFAHAVARLVPGDTLWVMDGLYGERLIIDASGTEDARITIAAQDKGAPVIDGTDIHWENYWFGLIEFRSGVEYVTLRGLTVRHAAGQGIQANDAAHLILEGNTTDTTVSSGIMLWGSSDIVIRDNTVIRACTGGEGYQECISVSHTDGFEVGGNIVRDGFMEGLDAKNGARNGRIFDNEIYNLPRLGIYIDAWDTLTENIEVFDNLVHHCHEGIRINSENGGLTRAIHVHHNLAYENVECGYWVGVGGVPETNHPVENIHFDGNVARDNGADGFRISTPNNGSTDDIVLTNNLIYRNGRAGIMVSNFSRDSSGRIGRVDIVNNTVYENGSLGGWGCGGIMVTSYNEGQDVTIRNNIVAENYEFSIIVAEEASSHTDVDHNLVRGFRSEPEELRGRSAVTGRPRFMNAEEGDFRLQDRSAAIDRGSRDAAPDYDAEGLARPVGEGIDIGALERAVFK